MHALGGFNFFFIKIHNNIKIIDEFKKHVKKSIHTLIKFIPNECHSPADVIAAQNLGRMIVNRINKFLSNVSVW